MKKARLVVVTLIVAVMASMFSFASADAKTITVNADKTAVSKGDVITVSYDISAGWGITALNLAGTFDPEVLKVVPQVNEDDEEVNSLVTGYFGIDAPYGPNNAQGVGIVGTTTGIKGKTKADTLFTVKFEVLRDLAADETSVVSATIVETRDENNNEFDITEDTIVPLVLSAPAPTTTTVATTTEAPKETTTTVAETTVAETTAAETVTEVETKTDAPKDNPLTGVVGVSAALVALAASGVVLVKSKKH